MDQAVVADRLGAIGDERGHRPSLGVVEDLEGEEPVGEIVQEVRVRWDRNGRLITSESGH
jgi:hypothetical protein